MLKSSEKRHLTVVDEVYVMLMMMRADDGYVAPADSGKCTLEERVDCILNADDTEACIAACSGKDGDQVDEPEEVKAGTLTVSLGDALADGTQIPNAGIVSFGTVNFKASSEDINLKSVTIKKQGLVKTMTNTKVWFEENGNRVSAKVSFNSDGEAIISFAPAYTVKANKTAKFDLYVDLTNAGLIAGTDLSFASVDVDSSAESNKGSFTTPTLRTANYQVADVQIFDTAATYSEATCTPGQETAGWTNDVRTHVAANCTTPATNFTAGTAVAPVAPIKSTATNNGWQLAEFRIENTSATEDVLVRSIQLRQEGAADLENISDVVLERNSEIVSTDYTIDGKYLTILLDNDKIEKGNNAVYTLRAKVNTVELGDTYEFYLKNAEDLNVVEATTDFRASLVSTNYGVAATTNTYGTTLTAIYTVEGGDVTFARDESLDLDQTVSAGSEVVLMQGTITTKESVTFENPTLIISAISAGDVLSDMFTTLYLKIGNSVFTYTAGNEDDGVNNTLAFDGTAVVNGKVNVKVYGTLKNTTANKSIRLDGMELATFTSVYYANEVPVAATASIGTIAGNSITVEGSTLNITRTDGLGNAGNISVGDGNTIYKANITSQSTQGAKIISITFNLTNTLNKATTLTLYVDGKAVSTRNIAVGGTSVVFNGLDFTVDKNTTAEIEVKANIKEGTTAATAIRLTSAAGGLSYVDLANNRTNPTPVATINGATMSVVEPAGTVTLDTDSVKSNLLAKGAKDQVIAAVKVKATEGSVRLYNLPLEAATPGQFVNISNVRLTNESGDVIATATTMDNNTIAFTNLSNTPFIEKDQTVTYNVVADINANITKLDLGVKLTAGALANCLRSSNGGNISVTLAAGTPVLHHVSYGNITLSVVKGTDIKTNALTFSVTANGADVTVDPNTIVTTATMMSLSQYGYEGAASVDLAMTHAKIYKNDLSNDVTALNAVVIPAGTTTTFIVAFPTATIKASPTDWNITLSNFGIVVEGGTLADDTIANVKGFKNIGTTLPFTSSK